MNTEISQLIMSKICQTTKIDDKKNLLTNFFLKITINNIQCDVLHNKLILYQQSTVKTFFLPCPI